MPFVAFLGGATWLARAVLGLTGPRYYAPVTSIDFAAVALTSLAFALLAPSLWWLASATTSSARTAAKLGGLAALLAAAGNFIEDFLRVPGFGTVHVIGALGLALALIATAALLFRAGDRWRAVVMAITVLGLFTVEAGGGIVVALAWMGVAVHRGPLRGARSVAGMSTCCNAPPSTDVFNEKTARDDAARYRRRGLDPLERKVVALIGARGIEGASVLEVGGGVGTIALELIRAGASRATNIELSPVYEEEARSLLAEHGLEERVDRRIGDFAAGPTLPAADIVVLHKVVCCYPQGAALMRAAAAHTHRILAVTFPRTTWWVRLAVAGANLASALRALRHRAFVHSAQAVVGSATAEGLRVAHDRQGIFWRTVVLERPGS